VARSIDDLRGVTRLRARRVSYDVEALIAQEEHGAAAEPALRRGVDDLDADPDAVGDLDDLRHVGASWRGIVVAAA
jgi:hypothetical protein